MEQCHWRAVLFTKYAGEEEWVVSAAQVRRHGQVARIRWGWISPSDYGCTWTRRRSSIGTSVQGGSNDGDRGLDSLLRPADRTLGGAQRHAAALDASHQTYPLRFRSGSRLEAHVYR